MDTNTQTAPLFLRISEFARLAAMSRSSAYAGVRKGKIPGVLIDGKWRIPRVALERLVAEAMRAGGDVDHAATERAR